MSDPQRRQPRSLQRILPGNLTQNAGHNVQAPRVAEALAREALELQQKALGEEHPDTAVTYQLLSDILGALGKTADAEALARKTLAIRRRIYPEGHAAIAAALTPLGHCFYKQGRYAEAEPVYRQALDLERKIYGDKNPIVGNSYGNLALNLNKLGKHLEAEVLSRQGLAILRQTKGDAHPWTASAYNNLALILQNQAKYAEADAIFVKALAIQRHVFGEDHPNTGLSYTNLAVNLNAQRRYAEAEENIRKGLDIRRRTLGDDHPLTSYTYQALGYNLSEQGKQAEAEAAYQKVVDIRRRTLGEEHPSTAHAYDGLATVLFEQGKHAEAVPLFRKALAIYGKTLGDDNREAAFCTIKLARTLLNQGKYQEAETLANAGLRGFEASRQSVAFGGLDRAAYTAKYSPLPVLIVCLARNGKHLEAWQRLETYLASGLWDDLAARPLTADEQERERELIERRNQLDMQIAALTSAVDMSEAVRAKLRDARNQRESVQADYARFEAGLAARYGVAIGQSYSLERVQAQVPAEAALLAWVELPTTANGADPQGDHWACLVRRTGPPTWVKLPGSGPDKAWTPADSSLPDQVREDIVHPPANGAEAEERLRQLARQRLSCLENHLGAAGGLPAVKHLIVMSTSRMAHVPLEALTESYTISYAPSATMLAWLREKRQLNQKPAASLLALGDPNFQKQGDLPALAPLPGTGREVKAIASLFPADKLVLLSSDASEQRLEELAGTAELRKFRYIHLATHGSADPGSRCNRLCTWRRTGSPTRWRRPWPVSSPTRAG